MALTAPAAQPRILTFNFHEPYLCLMAKTGLSIDVGVYEEGRLKRDWHSVYRPKPPNLKLLPEKEWRERAASGAYDVIVAQNEMNALDLAEADAAKLLLCHNRRTFLNATATSDAEDPVETFDLLLEKLSQIFQFIFISKSKRDSYGIPGRVILPGIDLEEYGGYNGSSASVLRVGNTMRQRGLMFDVNLQEALCRGLMNDVVGVNEDIPGAAPAASYEALLQIYRTARCMLHVSRQEYEDGYNLSMLEAMACGMPVVALANRTCPLTNGVDGFVSYDPFVLRQRIKELLADQDLAREIGARGRETVAARFSMDAFVENWREALFEAADQKPSRESWQPKPQPAERLNLLLHYVASPLTTARYFEAAAQPTHHVMTTGFRLPEDVLEMWGFPPPPPPYPEQRIPLPHKAPYAQLIEHLPQGYEPDLYFWLDSGPSQVESDIDLLTIPKVAYLIDTHVSPELRLEMARHFDCTFLAQKGQVSSFRAAGIGNVFWAPLGCHPEMHDVGELAREYDVAYVGSFSEEEGDRRRELLQKVAQCFPNHFMGRAWPPEMARIYARAKIVVNVCHNRDVNMRVFEAMASGALLLTEEAEGLDDLFEEGKHLLVYRSEDELTALIEEYLADEGARSRIAEAGRELVLREHTYAQRLEAILEQTKKALGLTFRPRAYHQPKMATYYAHPRREVIQHVPFLAKRILDVGCGAGVLGHTLKEERGTPEVVGIELIEKAYHQARKVLDNALLGSIEEIELPYEDGHFDCITCADVLEHLVEPAAVLRKLARVLAPDGVIVVSIPNVRYHEVINMLVSGAWTYMDAGILDSTHLRFFTRASLVQLMEDAGLEVAELHPLNIRHHSHFPRDENGSLCFGKLTLEDVDDAEHEEFLVYQYMVCACKPGLDRLEPAREALRAHKDETAYALALDAVGVDEGERRHIVAKALARIGKLDEAERYYQEALELRSDPAVQGEYGILLTGMNRAANARPLLEASLQANPQQSRVMGTLGLVLLAEGELEEAFKLLSESLDASYDNLALLHHYAALATELDLLVEAEPLVARYAEFYPGNLDVACDHAELLATLERHEEACRVLEGVTVLNPEHERAQELRRRMDEHAAGQ